MISIALKNVVYAAKSKENVCCQCDTLYYIMEYTYRFHSALRQIVIWRWQLPPGQCRGGYYPPAQCKPSKGNHVGRIRIHVQHDPIQPNTQKSFPGGRMISSPTMACMLFRQITICISADGNPSVILIINLLCPNVQPWCREKFRRGDQLACQGGVFFLSCHKTQLRH